MTQSIYDVFDIPAEHERIKRKIAKLQKRLKILQDDICKHYNATKEYKSNTGNYDPSADSYWIEFKCPDCGKHWTEEQQ